MPPRKAGAVVAALALLLASCVWQTGEPPMLSVGEALDLASRGQAVLVDVRSADAYVRGHLPGAVNLPFPDVVGHAAELRRMRLPILYCG